MKPVTCSKNFGTIFTCLAAFVMLANAAHAQYTLRIVLTTESHKKEPVFVAGNFNNWNPGSKEYKFQLQANQQVLQVPDVQAGTYQFKFTRGTWSTVACEKSGADLNNIVLQLSSDTTIHHTVQAWKDDFAESKKKHTASKNVRVMDTAFYMPELVRHRRISIYLPPGYTGSSTRYPVLYMHDGQNLFDDYLAGFGEWGVDEALDSLSEKGHQSCIVIAIDNGPKRLNEYNPFYLEKFGDGEGDNYVNFIANTLKPFIDKRYRTLPTKNNTIIAGSSMGGLISYYAILKYPEVFGKAGIFSPAFWTTGSGIGELTDSLGGRMDGMLFFYMGGLEGKQYLTDMTAICDKLGKLSTAYIYTAIDEKGRHNEAAWRKWFAEFYKWITANGNNYIIKTPD